MTQVAMATNVIPPFISLNQVRCSYIFGNLHDEKTVICTCMPELTDTCKTRCNGSCTHFPHLFTWSIILCSVKNEPNLLLWQSEFSLCCLS